MPGVEIIEQTCPECGQLFRMSTRCRRQHCLKCYHRLYARKYRAKHPDRQVEWYNRMAHLAGREHTLTSINLPNGILGQVRVLASTYHTTQSEIIRYALVQYLQRPTRPQATLAMGAPPGD